MATKRKVFTDDGTVPFSFWAAMADLHCLLPNVKPAWYGSGTGMRRVCYNTRSGCLCALVYRTKPKRVLQLVVNENHGLLRATRGRKLAKRIEEVAGFHVLDFLSGPYHEVAAHCDFSAT